MRMILAALTSACLLGAMAAAQPNTQDNDNRPVNRPKSVQRHYPPQKPGAEDRHNDGLAHVGDEHGPFGSTIHPHTGGTGNVQATGMVTPGDHPARGEMAPSNPESREARHRWDRYRGELKAEHSYHAGNWSAPAGYTYHRWRSGQRMPGTYLGHRYWISNAGAFGLITPPPDTVWVRYGPDAVLVDRVTGDIVRIRYGVFD